MMKNPCHAGELLEDSFGADRLDISIAEAARHSRRFARDSFACRQYTRSYKP